MAREINMDDILEIVENEFKVAKQDSYLYTANTLARLSVYSEVLSRICENTFTTPKDFLTYINIRHSQEMKSYFATVDGDPLKKILSERADVYRMITILVQEEEQLLKDDTHL